MAFAFLALLSYIRWARLDRYIVVWGKGGARGGRRMIKKGCVCAGVCFQMTGYGAGRRVCLPLRFLLSPLGPPRCQEPRVGRE